MMKMFLFLLALISTQALASPITVDAIYAPDGLTIYNQKATLSLPASQVSESLLSASVAATVQNKTFDKTSNVAKQARAVYDFTVLGGATDTNIDLGVSIPAKSVIVNAWMDVITQPTSASAARIGLSLANATQFDLQPSLLVSGLSAGIYQLLPRGSSSSSFKIQAAQNIILNERVSALTAGKIAIFVDYLISE